MSAISLLDFESDIGKMEAAIELLRESDNDNTSDTLKQINALEKDKVSKLKHLYKNLSDWQVCQVARHAARPQALDYINALTEDFMELRGDRLYADDRAIICGIARFNDTPVMLIGNQKGTDTDGRVEHNFGMSGPEGYRKVLRAMEMAEKFNLPIISLVDTPGAYPGIGAEERGQSGAIGTCLLRSASLRTPFIVVVIGEGGSGGALAMSVGDHIAIMQYSVYSVISPEGGASILWKDGSRMEEAATLLGITSIKLKKLGLVDEIIPEPIGGAHRYHKEAIDSVKTSITTAMQRLLRLETNVLLDKRQTRWRTFGQWKESSNV